MLHNGWKGVRQTVTLRYKGGRGDPNFVKKCVTLTVERSLIFPISNEMFPSQSAPKVLFGSNKDIIFIMELHTLHKIGENKKGVV